jgi:SsrA-binding protein
MASQAREVVARSCDRDEPSARHEYEILETVEAGWCCAGTEVKSLRDGLVNFKDSYASVRNGEGWLLGCHISPYSHGTDANHDPNGTEAPPS